MQCSLVRNIFLSQDWMRESPKFLCALPQVTSSFRIHSETAENRMLAAAKHSPGTEFNAFTRARPSGPAAVGLRCEALAAAFV